MKVTNLPGHDSWLLLLMLGLVCLMFAPVVAPWTTRLAGLVMIVLGAEQSAAGFREKKYRQSDRVQPALGLLLAAVGAAALWLGERTLLLICAVWGVFGLFQAAHTLNGVIARLALGRVPWWHCLAAALEIALALELIFTSGEAIVLHVRLLGLQLLSAAFSYRRRETFTLE